MALLHGLGTMGEDVAVPHHRRRTEAQRRIERQDDQGWIQSQPARRARPFSVVGSGRSAPLQPGTDKM